MGKGKYSSVFHEMHYKGYYIDDLVKMQFSDGDIPYHIKYLSYYSKLFLRANQVLVLDTFLVSSYCNFKLAISAILQRFCNLQEDSLIVAYCDIFEGKKICDKTGKHNVLAKFDMLNENCSFTDFTEYLDPNGINKVYIYRNTIGISFMEYVKRYNTFGDKDTVNII